MVTRRVKQRERVLEVLRTSPRPLDAHHLATELDLHVTTVRFHLTGLVDEGLVRTLTLPVEGVGRPRLGYSAVKEPSYSTLVALFAARIGGTPEEREHAAFDAGGEWADLLGITTDPAATDPGALVIDALDRLGFQTQTATNAFGTHSITLCTCPLADIARSHPEVVRGIQRGLIQRVLDGHSDTLGRAYVAEVYPDPSDGNCLVRLVVRPQEDTRTTTARDDGRVVTG